MFDNASFYIVNGRNLELYDQNLDNIGTLSYDQRISHAEYQKLKN